jgi:hypothetical protein
MKTGEELAVFGWQARGSGGWLVACDEWRERRWEGWRLGAVREETAEDAEGEEGETAIP